MWSLKACTRLPSAGLLSVAGFVRCLEIFIPVAMASSWMAVSSETVSVSLWGGVSRRGTSCSSRETVVVNPPPCRISECLPGMLDSLEAGRAGPGYIRMVLLGTAQVSLAELVLRSCRAHTQGMIQVTAPHMAQAQHAGKRGVPAEPAPR